MEDGVFGELGPPVTVVPLERNPEQDPVIILLQQMGESNVLEVELLKQPVHHQ